MCTRHSYDACAPILVLRHAHHNLPIKQCATFLVLQNRQLWLRATAKGYLTAPADHWSLARPPCIPCQGPAWLKSKGCLGLGFTCSSEFFLALTQVLGPCHWRRSEFYSSPIC